MNKNLSLLSIIFLGSLSSNTFSMEVNKANLEKSIKALSELEIKALSELETSDQNTGDRDFEQLALQMTSQLGQTMGSLNNMLCQATNALKEEKDAATADLAPFRASAESVTTSMNTLVTSYLTILENTMSNSQIDTMAPKFNTDKTAFNTAAALLYEKHLSQKSALTQRCIHHPLFNQLKTDAAESKNLTEEYNKVKNSMDLLKLRTKGITVKSALESLIATLEQAQINNK